MSFLFTVIAGIAIGIIVLEVVLVIALSKSKRYRFNIVESKDDIDKELDRAFKQSTLKSIDKANEFLDWTIKSIKDNLDEQ